MKSEKVTERGRRLYDDACGAAHALDLVGERWALLVMRELMLGPKRFSELRADLPGISANVLTQRLEGLEAAGILVRRKLPPPASVQVYELTPWGYESEPIFQVLGRWAARSPSHDPTLPLSATSLFLSFRTMFDPARAQGFSAQIGFRFGEVGYLVRVEAEAVEVVRGSLDGAQAIIAGTPPAVAGAVYGGVPLDALTGSGALAIEGDRAAFERFATLFPLPPKAPPVDNGTR
jgi:DNA-binding HxlR family transcriptional regulator